MSARQQRRELKTIAENLHRIAGDIEAVAAPGRLGLRRLDKDVAAGALIGGGATLFESAAAVLRSGKPNDADLAAADVLEKTECSIRSGSFQGRKRTRVNYAF